MSVSPTRLPNLPRLPAMPRPPRLSHPPTLPSGPRLFARRPLLRIGPGPAPPGFVGATTSASEWPGYWALAVIFDDPHNPRQGPFYGAQSGVWRYQDPQSGGRRLPGGAVVDYVVYLPHEVVGIRLQTYRFHLAAGSAKQAFDEESQINLERFMRLEDVYEQDFIADPSGAAVIKAFKRAIAGERAENPLRTGTTQQIRAVVGA